MLYKLYVNNVYMFCSDNADSDEEFIDTFFTLIEDMLYEQVKDTDVNKVLNKLTEKDYYVVVDRENNEVNIYVDIEH